MKTPEGRMSRLTSAATEGRDRLAGQGTDRSFYLPRLPREYYQGDAVVHWTLSVAKRGDGWLNEIFHARFREMMLHAAAREGLFCPTYCLMPDHIHLVWMGLQHDTDQRNGMKFLREHIGRLLRPRRFQHQPHDHVLREEQRQRGVFRKVCFYVIDNARVEKLVEHPQDWPFAGAIVPGYPGLHPLAEDFWPLFWKLYLAVRTPDAGHIKRPSLSTRSSGRQSALTP
jgi:putative transposase